jgi:hypothetical protein
MFIDGSTMTSLQAGAPANWVADTVEPSMTESPVHGGVEPGLVEELDT